MIGNISWLGRALVAAVVCVSLGAVGYADMLDFEDADGVTWNGNLYGEPVFGPGETAPMYHGFDLTGWRVYSMDGRGNGGGVVDVYGTGCRQYVVTEGDRCITPNSFDPMSISRAEEFFFSGARIASTDGSSIESTFVSIQGFKGGARVWSDLIEFDLGDDGSSVAVDYICPFSAIAVDSVQFDAWELYEQAFAVDNFTYTPEPTAMAVLALGGLALIRRRRTDWRRPCQRMQLMGGPCGQPRKVLISRAPFIPTRIEGVSVAQDVCGGSIVGARTIGGGALQPPPKSINRPVAVPGRANRPGEWSICEDAKMSMRNVHKYSVVFLWVVLCTWTSARAAATASAEVSIDWTTLSISLGDGMGLTWTKQGSGSEARAYFDGVQKDGRDEVSEDWSDTSAIAGFAANGGRGAGSSWTTTETLGVKAEAFSDLGGKFGADAHAYGENRWGSFTVTGDGYVTFSVDYSASITLNETQARPLDVCSALVEMDLWLNYEDSPLVPQPGNTYPWWDDREKWIPDWDPPLNDTWRETSTLTVTLWFDDGQAGVMRAAAASHASAESVPEPASMALLALGGLALIRRRKA